tara:strand:+ start:506 stop:850 length:345 start_codon:yes stop_codon:yes gene_type:complete
MDLFKGYWEDLTIPKEWECNAFHHNTAPSWVFGELELFVNHPDGYNTEGKLPSGTPRFIIMNEDKEEFKTNNFKDAIQVMYNHALHRAQDAYYWDCVKARREKNNGQDNSSKNF